MKDGNFWHLGGVTIWNSQVLSTYMNFFCHHFFCFTVVPCLFWISLWFKNRCPQHSWFKNLCKIARTSKNSDSNAQQVLSDLLTHSWFLSMLFALPTYQFPYIVMNRCLYLVAPRQECHNFITNKIDCNTTQSKLCFSQDPIILTKLPWKLTSILKSHLLQFHSLSIQKVKPQWDSCQ